MKRHKKTMEIADNINILEDLLTHSRLNRVNYNDSNKVELDKKILEVYDNIINDLASDYERYKNNIAYLCTVLNEIDNSSTYLLKYFLDSQLKMNDISVKIFDDKILDIKLSNENILLKLYEKNFSTAREIFFTDELDLGVFDEKKFEECLSLIIKVLQRIIDDIDTEPRNLHNLSLDYTIGRQVANKIGQIELLYLSAIMYVERWTSIGHNQVARDKAETFLYSSFIDSVPEYGFLIFYYTFSSQGSLNDSLVYGALAMNRMKSAQPVNQKLLYYYAYSVLRMYRNTNLLTYLIDFYVDLPVKFINTFHEQVQIDFIYFSSIISIGNKEIVEEMVVYIIQKLDFFVEGGESDCAPWLSLLYNVKRFHSRFEIPNELILSIDKIIETLEKQVNSKFLATLKNVSLGEITEIKEYLGRLLVNLNETRHVDDFVIDVEKAINIASALIDASYIHQDIDGFIKAMVVKSDSSIDFKNETGVHLMSREHRHTKKIFYDNVNSLQLKGKLKIDNIVIFIGSGSDKAYELEISKSYNTIKLLENWNYQSYYKWIDVELSNLYFSDTNKNERTGAISQNFYEDYLEQARLIKKDISFFKMNTVARGSILLVKDMKLSGFPHNLLIGYSGEYLHLENPLIDIVSTDRFYSSDEIKTIVKDFNIGMWIPTEGQDYALNYLADKLESVIINAHINTFNSLHLDKPLNYDINIVAAHGERGIKSFNALFINDTQLTIQLNKYVGQGVILIFFVCHSGAMNEAKFSNKIDSLVRQYIEAGYQAVIAPFWGLSILVPPIWLPKLLESLNLGKTVTEAVFDANKEVYNHYPTPVAWACMHLYGNPYLRVNV